MGELFLLSTSESSWLRNRSAINTLILISQRSRLKTANEENKSHTLSQVTFFSSNKVTKADGGESDDDEVDGLECAPAFDVLEDDSWQGHEDETPEQDEEQRGDDTDLCLAYFPFLREDLWILIQKMNL